MCSCHSMGMVSWERQGIHLPNVTNPYTTNKNVKKQNPDQLLACETPAIALLNAEHSDAIARQEGKQILNNLTNELTVLVSEHLFSYSLQWIHWHCC